MKVCLFPKKEAVRSILQGQLDAASEGLASAERELADLGRSAIWQEDSKKRVLLASADLFRRDISDLTGKLTLLDAHDPAECRVELEIG